MKLKQMLLGHPKTVVPLPEQAAGSTEEWLSVADVRNGVIALKDGRFIKIIEIFPVNFLLKGKYHLLLCQLLENCTG